MSTETVSPSSSNTNGPPLSSKRKVADAFDALDDASRPYSDATDRPTPSKRPHFPSHQSAFLKYGILSRPPKLLPNGTDTLSKIAPHLAAILGRTRKTSKNADDATSHSSSSKAEYRPASVEQFLNRLSTFKLATYANKPAAVDAVAAAKCGWIHDGGKDRLLCEMCRATWIVSGREGMNRDAANALLEKQKRNLIEMHKDDCPWRIRQCDASIYCVPLQPSIRFARQIKARAAEVQPLITDVRIKHPLATSQVSSLNAIFTTVSIPPAGGASSSNAISDATNVQEPTVFPSPDGSGDVNPSETAIVIALFGWAPAPSATSEPPERRRTMSAGLSRPVSRASSVAPSASRPSTPAPSASRTTSPQASPSRPLIRPRVSSLSSRPATPISVTSSSRPRPSGSGGSGAMLHCTLCQRRIGLWTFAPPPDAFPPPTPSRSGRAVTPASERSFDVLREHRSYCPYVVASTTVPSLPTSRPASSAENSTGSTLSVSSSPTSHTMEGWKAVVEVVLRLRPASRPRVTSDNAGQMNADDGDDDRVGAMVQGVKARGGRELLRYVRGLLG